MYSRYHTHVRTQKCTLTHHLLGCNPSPRLLRSLRFSSPSTNQQKSRVAMVLAVLVLAACTALLFGMSLVEDLMPLYLLIGSFHVLFEFLYAVCLSLSLFAAFSLSLLLSLSLSFSLLPPADDIPVEQRSSNGPSAGYLT